MKVVVATDVTIFHYGDSYFFPTQVSTILKRYYDRFGKISICCRLKEIKEKNPVFEDVSYLIDAVVAIHSLKEVVLGKHNKNIKRIVQKCDLIICRCPGIIAYCAADYARKCRKRYFAEIMGCTWDSHWNHSLVGKISAPFVFLKMKETVFYADYALYVTNEFLQNRYPCKNPGIAASNVQLMEIVEDMLKVRSEKISNCTLNSITLMTTAAVDVRYKGQEYVIKAIPMLNKAGIRVRYLLVGGGDQAYLRRIAEKYGVSDQIEFIGRRPLEEVFKLLDTVDIYVQPSLQEGLPRSVIEAMSRGCPVIGAKTAGIPELISPECVVKRKSAKDIACKIMQILSKDKLMELSERNFEESKQYRNSVLNEKRERYFSKIRDEITKNM